MVSDLAVQSLNINIYYSNKLKIILLIIKHATPPIVHLDIIQLLAECNRTLGHSQHLRTNRLVYCIHTH